MSDLPVGDHEPTEPRRRYPQLEAHKWRPGESGNPSGSKPRAKFCEALSELLAERVDPSDLASKTRMRALAEKALEMAMQGGSVGVKAMAVLLPQLSTLRDRAAIRAGGDVNILQAGDVNIRQALDEFLVDLPNAIREAQLPVGVGGDALRAFAKRFGPISLSPETRTAMIENIQLDIGEDLRRFTGGRPPD